MRFRAILVLVAATAFAVGFGTGDGHTQNKNDIKLVRIKTADVEKAIAAHKGKVVLLDVWAEF